MIHIIHFSYNEVNYYLGLFGIKSYLEITAKGKHRQALRELYVRYTGLVQQHYEVRKLQIDIGRSEIRFSQAQDRLCALPQGDEDKYAGELAALDVDEAGVDLEMKRWQLENLKLTVKETLREMVIFKQELDQLSPQRKYDSYEEAEPEYWQTQYINERLSGNPSYGKPLNQLPPVPNRLDIEQQLRSKHANSTSAKRRKRR